MFKTNTVLSNTRTCYAQNERIQHVGSSLQESFKLLLAITPKMQDNDTMPMYHLVTGNAVRAKCTLHLSLAQVGQPKAALHLAACSFHSLALRSALPIHHSKARGLNICQSLLISPSRKRRI